MQRLEGFLSGQCGLSRKQWKERIRAGRVTCNGAPVLDPARQIDPARDTICIDGEALTSPQQVVLLLHKPAGYLTATQDRQDKTVMDLLPPAYAALGLRPVGRLDKQTEGLLLLTNDGALLHRLISPRYAVAKRYYAEHDGTATESDVAAFAAGLTLRDGTRCRPAALRPLGPGRSEVILQEGKYHQVRRMLAARGMPVTYLRRDAEGGLTLQGLPCGAVRPLTEPEIAALESRQDDETFSS